MRDYYEVLDIKAGASSLEIKKAYFTMVRKYPPDRFQEEFMEIREAYEALSNEKTRREYDALAGMSVIARTYYDMARNKLDDGDAVSAIKILEEILGDEPESLLIKALLGEAYRINGNSGKALKIFEELTSIDPGNASFAGHLAQAYLVRGWQRRAITAFKRAIALDEDNISLRIGLSDAYIANKEAWYALEILEETLERAKENKSENTAIYLKLIMLNLSYERKEQMEKYLKELTAFAINNKELRDNVGWTLAQLAKSMLQHSMVDEADSLMQEVVKILPEDKNIIELRDHIKNFAHIDLDFKKMDMDEKIVEDIKMLVAFEALPEENIELGGFPLDMATVMGEMRVLMDANKYKASIKRLKSEYPQLYKLKAEFFENVMDNTKHKSMLKKYNKQMASMMHLRSSFLEGVEDDGSEEEDYFGYEDDYEAQQPFVREEPKTGRNDPCPCGSGKKYKKCCGKNS